MDNEKMKEKYIQEKFNRYKYNDPFPDIPPALLNTCDIEKYVDATSMIYPFDKSKLKTATYGVPFYREIHYWEDGKHKIVNIDTNNSRPFQLKPNSIAYVHISTTFRVPYYIAFRFNLKIDLVHRGLLLGTGPVIDPGFQGRILIPLHNLTMNNYYLKPGEVLIWVEITKLSPYNKCLNIKKQIKYKFKSMLDYTAYDYFEKAVGLLPIESSIPNAISYAKRLAENTEKSVKKIQTIGLLAAIGAIYGGYSLITSVVTPTINLVNDYKDKHKELSIKVNELEQEIKQLKKSNDQIRNMWQYSIRQNDASKTTKK